MANFLSHQTQQQNILLKLYLGNLFHSTNYYCLLQKLVNLCLFSPVFFRYSDFDYKFKESLKNKKSL